MNRFKTCFCGPFVAALTLNFSLLALTSDHAKAENPDLVPGIILVAEAKGKVDAIDTKDKSTRSLKANDEISQGYNVEVGEKSETVLVFGNGSILSLGENTKMELNKFVKDPFSAPFAQATDEIEPGVSETSLKLIEGSVLYTSMKLRTDQGSSHEIHTDAGTTSVKGTTYSLSYIKSNDGVTVVMLAVAEGSVQYTDADGNVQTVNAGEALTFTGTVSQDQNGGFTFKATSAVGSWKDTLSTTTVDDIMKRAAQARKKGLSAAAQFKKNMRSMGRISEMTNAYVGAGKKTTKTKP